MAIRVDAGQRAEEDGGQGVGEEEYGPMQAGPADAVGEDQQGEHEELVGKLRGDLGQPDAPEVGGGDDCPKATGLGQDHLPRSPQGAAIVSNFNPVSNSGPHA